jgi:MraZ protein
MFRGRYEHSIDQKGRISVPSRFREILATQYDERLIVTNFDQCLWAYPVAEWKKVEEKVAALPQLKAEVKALQRFFISAASEAPLDKQGRILIPPTLREYADLNRDCVMVGMSQRIEIWSLERWNKIFKDAEKTLQESIEQLTDLGI